MFKITINDLLASSKLTGHLHKGLAVYLWEYLVPGYTGSRCKARRRGKLVPPPNDHILNHLARDHNLLPEDVTMWSSPPGTVSVVAELPTCDECGAAARYDCPGTPWDLACFRCPSCWESTGSTYLGPGSSRYLMLHEEVPNEVRFICDDVTTELQRPSLWA